MEYRSKPLAAALALASLLAATTALTIPARAAFFTPGDLIVSTSEYQGSASTVTIGQPLPGGGNAVANGTYPGVFENAGPDASFGVTSPITLEELTTSGAPVTSLAIPTSVATTSFSSKSELALNLSPGGGVISFIGYLAPVNALDISNANTPGIIEPGNPDTATPTPRVVVTVNANGTITSVPTNAYPGNNGRAAVYVGNDTWLMAGNAGNGNGSPQVTAATGVQVLNAATDSITDGAYDSTKAGSFSIAQTNPATGMPYGTPKQIAKDKTAKDDNYRGLTIFDNTLYVTKGSGSNGINSVYQVGTKGTLPTTGSSNPINVLPGFPTTIARDITVAPGGTTGELGVVVPTGKVDAGFYPFGIWFANASTLYVADEGDGTAANASLDIESGLQKWSLIGGKWMYDYTLQAGLGLGQDYTVSGTDYAGDSGSYTAATDGLRNITGQVNSNGTVTIYGITSTVSDAGDEGADPNELVSITDTLSDLSLPDDESFSLLQLAAYGQVLRGVSFAPVPEPASALVFGVAMAGLIGVRRRINPTR